MITFFSLPRNFTGEFDQLQRRAIRSWLGAIPDCQVILFGNVSGLKEVAEELGINWDRDVKCNECDTPLINNLFERAGVWADHNLLCEISADIVLTPDFWPALETILTIEKPFVIGQRYDVEPGELADRTELHSPYGIDYFIYRKGTLGEIPPFVVGRTVYDNWLVWAAMELWGLTVIDATESITALHINHGYPEYGDKDKMLQGEERQENLRLSEETGCSHWGAVTDAPYVLSNGKILAKELA